MKEEFGIRGEQILRSTVNSFWLFYREYSCRIGSSVRYQWCSGDFGSWWCSGHTCNMSS